MKRLTALSREQRNLVETNLSVVRWAIRKSIVVNECIFGFGYDDLFQEGCIWLCKAAATFKEDKGVKFETYAQTVVTNGLLTYCRLMCNRQKRQIPVPESSDEDLPFVLSNIASADDLERVISVIDMEKLFESLKKQYSGVARLGIEAIELKIKGLSGAEIAAMYGVKPTHVGAWIHRAVQKLRQNEEFKKAFQIGRAHV